MASGEWRERNGDARVSARGSQKARREVLRVALLPQESLGICTQDLRPGLNSAALSRA